MSTSVNPSAVYQLRKFRYDNTPHYLRTTGAPNDGDNATDDEIRDLLIFAAGHAGPDPTIARNLEAHRVIRLVPEEIGAALFKGVQ